MFIKINNTHYFVITDGKSAKQITDEVITRMDKPFVSNSEYDRIYQKVKTQLY